MSNKLIKYYYCSILHKEDGSWPKNTKTWWRNGLKHRENGPATINSKDGYKGWWISGAFIKSEHEHEY